MKTVITILCLAAAPLAMADVSGVFYERNACIGVASGLSTSGLDRAAAVSKCGHVDGVAILTGSTASCVTEDCKALVAGNNYKACKSKDCTMVVSAWMLKSKFSGAAYQEKLQKVLEKCSTDNCRAIITENPSLCGGEVHETMAEGAKKDRESGAATSSNDSQPHSAKITQAGEEYRAAMKQMLGGIEPGGSQGGVKVTE